MRENPTLDVIPLMVQPFYCCDLKIGLSFYQILGQKRSDSGFQCYPYETGSGYKMIPSTLQSLQMFNLQSFLRQFPWDTLGGPEKDQVLCVCGEAFHVHSPQILLANWMSLGKMVTHLAWMAQRLVSSNSPMRYTSATSWSANNAKDWNRTSCATSIVTSLTSLWNGSFLMRNPVNFG